MQSLNVTNLTLAQIEKLSHKLPKYSMVNYCLLRKQLQQIDQSYPFYAHLAHSVHYSTGYAHGPKLSLLPDTIMRGRIIRKLKLCLPVPHNNLQPL